MLTRPIFIRPDSELIWESVCTCAKLFVDEENVGCAKIGTLRILHENDTKRRIQQNTTKPEYP